jgi:hypothetical protein
MVRLRHFSAAKKAVAFRGRTLVSAAMATVYTIQAGKNLFIPNSIQRFVFSR